jgi:hypothetical protein
MSWYCTTAIVTLVSLLLLVLAALLHGRLSDLLGWNFWRLTIDGIITVIYILAVYPFIVRLREQAIQAFRSLLPLADDAFDKLAADISKPNRRWEWLAILAGFALAAGLGQPWNMDWISSYWLNTYLVITSLGAWGLLCWLIYDILVSIVRISRLGHHDLNLDILDTEMLAPIARWSLGISLFFLGGISLNLVLETSESLLKWNNITAYIIVVCIMVLIFFLSMWSTHRAMSVAKKRKLALARKHLVVISHELEDRTERDQLGEMGAISYEITSWANYQRLVKEAPTWPFNASIIRKLLASIIVPATVYLIKILSGLGLRF